MECHLCNLLGKIFFFYHKFARVLKKEVCVWGGRGSHVDSNEKSYAILTAKKKHFPDLHTWQQRPVVNKRLKINYISSVFFLIEFHFYSHVSQL